METVDSDEPRPEETRRVEDPADLDGIANDYLQHILKKLECSFEEFPALLSSKLGECLREAERSSMERIRPSLDRLSVSDPTSPLSFREVFINAKSGAEKSVAGKIKSLESTFIQILHQSMDHYSENLATEIRRMNEGKVQAILRQHVSSLEDANESYRIFLKKYADCKDHWPEDKLEKIHNAGVQDAEKLLLAKLVGSDLAAGARALLLKELNSSLKLEFASFKQLNEQALESSRLKFREMASAILKNVQAGIPHILSGTAADPRTAIQNLHSEAVKMLLQAFSEDKDRNVGSQNAMHDTLNELDSFRDEALQNIQKLDIERARFGAALESAKTGASQLFIIKMQNYSKKFTILDESEYESKSKEFQSKVLSELTVNAELDSESIEKIKSSVKQALNSTGDTFWTETASKRNRIRDRIRNEMSSLKMDFKERMAEFLEAGLATIDPGTLLKRTLSRFSAGVLSNISNEFKARAMIRSELEKDLRKILKDTKLEVSALKADQEGQELIREFERLARKRKCSYEFYKEQQEKLSKIAKTALQQKRFQHDLKLVFRDIILERQHEIDRVNAFVEDRINNFKSALETKFSTKSMGEFQSEFVETLRKEARELEIHLTEHWQRLTDEMETVLQERKRIVSELVEKMVMSYIEEMRSHLKPPRIFSQEQLLALHRKIKTKMLQGFPNGTSTNAQSLSILELNKASQEFVNKKGMNTQKSVFISIYPTQVSVEGAAYEAAMLNRNRADPDERKRQNSAPGETSKRFKGMV